MGRPLESRSAHTSPAAIAPKATWGPETGEFAIGDLDPGLYVIRFRLFQGSVLQDVKYVKFRIGAPDVLQIGPLIPENPLIPFEDPELSTHELFYRGVSCGPKTIEFDIQATNSDGVSAVLFFRLKEADADRTTEFNEGWRCARSATDVHLRADGGDVPDFLCLTRRCCSISSS
jgi:hypothetical protein